MSHAARLRPLTPISLTALALVLALALAQAGPQPAMAEDDTPAPAETELQVLGVQLLEYGIYSSDIEYFLRDDGVADHNKILATNFVLIQATDQVRAELSTGFGIKYLIRGKPWGAAVDMDVVIDHPPLTNPQTGKTYTQSKVVFTRTMGKPEYTVWTFDEGWSLVPGTWTISLEYQGRVMVKKDFAVTLRQ